MNPAERDAEQLRGILRFCERLDEALQRFGTNYEVFENDAVFQDCCSLCLIQVGEAVNRLSPEFIERHPEIEWRRIYGMRCHLVHGYDMFDAEIVWDAIRTEIPRLRTFCEKQFEPEG